MDTFKRKPRESWEFRCEPGTHRWRWRALDEAGRTRAASASAFATLRDAIDDAARHGFACADARK